MSKEALKALDEYYKHRYKEQLPNGIVLAVCLIGCLILLIALALR